LRYLSYEVTKINKNKNVTTNFSSDFFNTRSEKETFLYDFFEKSSSQRYNRFNDIVFKYDYKSGDYFPKLYKEVYEYLIPTAAIITSGLKTSP